jgi:outer membrane protein assembly factor BamA
LKDGQYLIVKNEIRFGYIDSSGKKPLFVGTPIPHKSDVSYRLSTVIRQKPNEKILGIRLRTWIYNSVQARCDRKGLDCRKSKWRKFWLETVGEAPSVYDTLANKRTVESMSNLMEQLAYFDAKVSSQADTQLKRFGLFKRKKRTKVFYTVTPGKQLHIDSISVESPDSLLMVEVKSIEANTLLKTGNPLEASVLGAERSRITKHLKDKGYFYFVPNYILYDLDTFNRAGTDLYLNILPFKDSVWHTPYCVDSVFVFPNFDPGTPENRFSFDTVQVDGFYFLTPKNKKPSVRRKAISQEFTFGSGDLYSFSAFRTSTVALRDLSAFKGANIEYRRSSTDKDLLNSYVRLNPAKKMALGANLESNTDSKANLGFAANGSFRHNNLFGGSETLIFTVEGGLALNLNRTATNGVQQPLINSTDINANLSLYFPRYFGIMKFKKWLKMNNPKTKLSFVYNRFDRVSAVKYDSYNAIFGYDWSQDATKRHLLNVASFSLLQPTVDPAFDSLYLQNNPILRNTYQPYVIFSFLQYNLNYSKNYGDRGRNLNYKFRFEMAGNAINLLDQIPGIDMQFFAKTDNNGEVTSYTDYSQFILADFDLRYNLPVAAKTKFVTRAFVGAGIPFGNSKSLPYVKRFFGGGTNGIRAWRVRELGPGGQVPPDSIARIDQTGDVRLELNAELRFPVFSYLEGAVFVDMGNIWNIRSNVASIETLLLPENFLKQIAIGAGFGLRLNFSYFVLRLDLGIQVRTPYPNPLWNNKYWIQNLKSNNFDRLPLTWNLAVGYPF